VVLTYLLSRHRLAGGEAPSLSTGGAPDCRQNQQNRTIWFAKLDNPISVVSARSFRFLSDSCGNTFWRLRWGINYFKHVKHEGCKLWQQRIRPRQEQYPQANLRHPDGGVSLGAVICLEMTVPSTWSNMVASHWMTMKPTCA
jgi:hypothetical protein